MIEVKNLIVGYGSGVVLNDISICFPRGEITGIIGKNGCGKSTLIKASSGLLPYASGTIQLNNQDIDGLTAKDRAKKFQFCHNVEPSQPFKYLILLCMGGFRILVFPESTAKRIAKLLITHSKNLISHI